MDERGRASTDSAAPPDSTIDEPRTRAFLFCDLRDYTSFIEARGDRAGAALLDRYRSIVRSEVARAAGAEIRTEGDSFYVVFGSASPAVRCGLRIIAAAESDSRDHADAPIRVGVGIHAGESVEGAEGFVGSAVNIAARICAQAAPGEVLVSDTVRGLVRTSLDVTYETRGRPKLKGISEPIALYRVLPRTGAIPSSGRTRSTGSGLGLRGLVVVGAVAVATVALLGWRLGGGTPSSTPTPSFADASESSVISGSATGASESPSALSGRLAFFASQVAGGDPHPRSQVYVAAATGGEWKRMTELTDAVTVATWSPDGRRLLYTVEGDYDQPPRIVAVESAPAWVAAPWPTATDVIEIEGIVYFIASLGWTPDDEIIVGGFTPEDPAGARIFAVSGDGMAVRLVTRPVEEVQGTYVHDVFPAVSPDGETVTFYSGATAETGSLWAAGTDGTGRIEITDEINPYIGEGSTGAVWSPDASRLVLSAQSQRGGPIEIWTMRAQGTDLRRLTTDDITDDRPAWSPDGRWIAWTRTVSGQRQIWVMTSDGQDPRPLVVGAAGENLDLVGWAPDPA